MRPAVFALIAIAAGAQVVARPAEPPDPLHPLALQIALDRAGFSPGVIDGRMGRSTGRALEAYQREHGREPGIPSEPLATYRITEADIAGPFATEIPADLVEQAKLPALAYTNVVELLAERFHAAPALLRRLNPQATFAAGEEIRVPAVEPFIVPAPRPEPAPRAATEARGTSGQTEKSSPLVSKPDVVVTVSEGRGSLIVTDNAERTIFFAPVTTGSTNDPLPTGEWKVKGIQFNPTFHYNPDLFWDADPSHSKAKIPPGPNNPVGVVWIDLSKEHFGLHGTPEPERIGRTESHGCVRLTNWDALKVAGMVKPGTRVVFVR